MFSQEINSGGCKLNSQWVPVEQSRPVKSQNVSSGFKSWRLQTTQETKTTAQQHWSHTMCLQKVCSGEGRRLHSKQITQSGDIQVTKYVSIMLVGHIMCLKSAGGYGLHKGKKRKKKDNNSVVISKLNNRSLRPKTHKRLKGTLFNWTERGSL